jgi:hypothetical protein
MVWLLALRMGGGGRVSVGRRGRKFRGGGTALSEADVRGRIRYSEAGSVRGCAGR